jgi:hypothetical protein
VKQVPASLLLVRSTYAEPLARTKPSVYRVVFSLLSLLAAVTVVVALTVQIAEQVATNRFVPESYFAYFTIQSSIINVVVLLASGLHGFSTTKDSTNWTAVRAHIVAYAVITASVYNLLLRDVVVDSSAPPLLQWPNEITHVWIPLYLVLDWILNPNRSHLPAKALSLGVLFPLLWVLFTLGRGEITGWYPYQFMNPDSEMGVIGQVTHLGVIGLLIILTLIGTGMVNRIHDKLTPTGGLRL